MKAYSEISTAEDNVKRRIGRVFREYMPFIILVVNIIGYAATKLFNAWLVNPFTPQYFVDLATNVLSTALTFACFIGYGERQEKLNISGYQKNAETWAEMSGKVRTHYSEAFVKHCKARVEQEREEKRLAIISNSTTMSSEYYLRNFRDMSDEKLRELRASGTISREEYKAIKRANGNMRIKPINPLLILCGVRVSHLNDAGRDGISFAKMSLIMRPAFTLIATAFLAMIKGTLIGFEDTSVVYDIIYMALSIVLASYSGYSAGATSARQEFDRIKQRVFFLEDFLNKNT